MFSLSISISISSILPIIILLVTEILGQEDVNTTTTVPANAQECPNQYNETAAECSNPKEAMDINTYKEWSAMSADLSDGFCYDNQGVGYGVGHTYTSCSGCISYNCTYLPCTDRDGSKYKMFWQLVTVGSQCCQSCDGKVYPPSSVLSTTSLGDTCDTVEQVVCRTNNLPDCGTIEVSYTYGNCCQDGTTWYHAGDAVLEHETCSVRTCNKGRPAHWDRDTIYMGGCGCCEYNSTLYPNGNCTQINGARTCCCEGVWAVPTSTGVSVNGTRN